MQKAAVKAKYKATAYLAGIKKPEEISNVVQRKDRGMARQRNLKIRASKYRLFL